MTNVKTRDYAKAVKEFSDWMVASDYVNREDMDRILKEWASSVAKVDKNEVEKSWRRARMAPLD